MKQIRIQRPVDPELAQLWDEAKRAVLDRECCRGDIEQCRCRNARWLAAPDAGGGEE